MLLTGTLLTVDVRFPVFGDVRSVPVTVPIRDDAIEIGNVEDTEVDTSVVGAQFDVQGSDIVYGILGGAGSFANVNDATGFNGYRLFFEALSDGAVSIRDVEVVAATNSLGIDPARVGFTRDTVTMNVDGIAFQAGDGVVLRIGFDIAGGRGAETLAGETGRDRISGKSGADFLGGGAGNDVLDGGRGSDTLSGGEGNDVLKGRDGADVFVLAAGSGRDRVLDLDPLADRVLVQTGATGFDDLRIRSIDGGVQVGDGQDRLVLAGVAIEDVSATLFLF
jgi:Ca2+-binding RTX toxin-like protein